jgi:hypothetical protein
VGYCVVRLGPTVAELAAELEKLYVVERPNDDYVWYQLLLTKIALDRPFLRGLAQIWRMLQRNDATSTAARAGNLIYWTGCAAALLWAIFVLLATADLPHPDWTISTPIAMVGAVVIWSAGRVARHALIRWEHFDQKGNSDAGSPTSKRSHWNFRSEQCSGAIRQRPLQHHQHGFDGANYIDHDTAERKGPYER